VTDSMGATTQENHVESDSTKPEYLEPLANATAAEQPLKTEYQNRQDGPVTDELMQPLREYGVHKEPSGLVPHAGDSKLEQPLSPFGIREKLLPPPVPASLTFAGSKEVEGRRHSVFSPIIFRNSTNWSEKYSMRTDSATPDLTTLQHYQI